MTGILTPLPTLDDLFAQLREAPAEYKQQAERRAAFVAEIQRRNAEAEEASNDTLSGSLKDAGFDSFGPM